MKRISGIALASLGALAVFACTKGPSPAAVEKITVTPDEVSMKPGETMSLECLVTPPDATAGKIFWKSSAPHSALNMTNTLTAPKWKHWIRRPSREHQGKRYCL